MFREKLREIFSLNKVKILYKKRGIYRILSY